jgi:hypothetical protein
MGGSRIRAIARGWVSFSAGVLSATKKQFGDGFYSLHVLIKIGEVWMGLQTDGRRVVIQPIRSCPCHGFEGL